MTFHIALREYRYTHRFKRELTYYTFFNVIITVLTDSRVC